MVSLLKSTIDVNKDSLIRLMYSLLYFTKGLISLKIINSFSLVQTAEREACLILGYIDYRFVFYHSKK